MNRWDAIQAAARDVADWVCNDPADRNKMADDLIKLVCLVVQGVGKGVAIEAESEMNDVDASVFELDTMSIEYSDDECGRLEAEFEQEKATDAAKAHNRYLVGEGIQDAARKVREEAMGADLERYERDGVKTFQTLGGTVLRTVRERDTTAANPDPRPLFAPGAEAYYRKVLGLDPPDTTATPQQHAWVTATDGDTGASLGWHHCGACGIRKCDGGCGDASVGATPDADCATHGNDVARRCNG